MSTVAFQTSPNAINIKSIEFTDGTRLTFEQAAKLIKKEGRLSYGPYIKNSTRSAIGVLEGWSECGNCVEPMQCFTPIKHNRLHNLWFSVCISTENDRPSEETPESACERMVKYLRSWKRK